MTMRNCRDRGQTPLVPFVMLILTVLLCGCGRRAVNSQAAIVEWCTAARLPASQGHVAVNDPGFVFLVVRASLPNGVVWSDTGRDGDTYRFCGPPHNAELFLDGRQVAEATFFSTRAKEFSPYKVNSMEGFSLQPKKPDMKQEIRFVFLVEETEVTKGTFEFRYADLPLLRLEKELRCLPDNE